MTQDHHHHFFCHTSYFGLMLDFQTGWQDGRRHWARGLSLTSQVMEETYFWGRKEFLKKRGLGGLGEMRNCQEGKRIIKRREETISKQRSGEQKRRIKNSFAVTTQMFELPYIWDWTDYFLAKPFFFLQLDFLFWFSLVFEAHCSVFVFSLERLSYSLADVWGLLIQTELTALTATPPLHPLILQNTTHT